MSLTYNLINQMKYGKLYLIPTPIAEGAFGSFFPVVNADIINETDYYIVEAVRTARRFLRYAEEYAPRRASAKDSVSAALRASLFPSVSWSVS